MPQLRYKKDSEFSELFNYHIKKYRERGILKAMYHTAFHGRIDRMDKYEDKVQSIEGKAPSLADLHYAFIGSGAVLAVALVLLICEVCWDSLNSQYLVTNALPLKSKKDMVS